MSNSWKFVVGHLPAVSEAQALEMARIYRERQPISLKQVGQMFDPPVSQATVTRAIHRYDPTCISDTRASHGPRGNYKYREQRKKPLGSRTLSRRKCLRCPATFLSHGPHDRLCDPCGEAVAQLERSAMA